MIIDSPIISGSYLSTGSLSQTGNVSITGSLTVTAGISGSFSGSGADLFGIPASGITGLNLSQISSGSVSASISPNQGLLINTSVSASNFTGSFTGSLTGIATSASYASFALTSSYSLGGSGFPFSGSAVITGSLLVSGSQTLTGSLSTTGPITASSVLATGTITAQTLVVSTISSSVQYSSGSNIFGNSTANTQTFTGSVNITGSAVNLKDGIFSGSGANLFGIPATGITGLNLSQIASGSASASISPNNGLVVNTNTRISGSTQITGSLGVTGSFSVSGSTGTVFSSNADTLLISGSLLVTGSAQITGSLSVSGSITGSLFGTASFALDAATLTGTGSVGFTTTASFLAVSASYIALSASYNTFSGSTSTRITTISSSQQDISASQQQISASLLTISRSYASTGSNTFVGLETITGSLIVTGSVSISTLTTGSGIRYVIADQNGLLSAQTASAAIFTTQQVVSTAGQTTFPITNGYATGYVTVFVNGTKLSADEYVDTSGTNIVFLTGSTAGDNVEFQKYLPAAGVSNNTLRSTNYFTATTGQTNFSVNYTPGLIDIFYNGAKLDNTEYTAANGTSITLATASAAGDRLEVDVYSYQVGAFSGIGGTGAANQLAYFNTSNSITGSNAFTVSGSAVIITGSLTVSGSGTFTNIGPAVFSGSVTAVGGFSGSFSGNADSASLAQNSLLLQGTGSIGFATTASLLAVSASQQQISASLLNVVANYATTGSNSFRADQSITGSLVVSSTITAQTLVVQTVTSSIVYSSGSNNFGNQSANTQTFTGSVNITGSTNITGNINLVSSTGFPTVGLLNRSSDTTLYMVSPSSGFILTDSSLNTIYNATPTAHNWNIGNSLKMKLDVSGSLGLGVTPSGWISTVKAFQLGNTAALYAPSSEAILSNNVFVDSTDNNKYITTNFASQYRQVNGQHIFYTAASGSAGNTISFGSAKLTISSDGAATFNSNVSATTGTTGATIKLGGFTNYGTIQDVNDVRRIWFENVGSYRTIFDLPTSGTSFAFRTNDGTSILSLTSSGSATFASSVDGTVFNSTSNAFRFNGNNALSLVSLNSQNVVKINAAGYWGVQLVGANDQGILINNTGNVGIGTTSPISNLHILLYDAGKYSGDLRIGGSEAQYGLNLKYDQSAATAGTIYCSPNYANASITLKLGAGNGNTNQMVLSGNGSVGFNCTPSSTYKIDLLGNQRITSTSGDAVLSVIAAGQTAYTSYANGNGSNYGVGSYLSGADNKAFQVYNFANSTLALTIKYNGDAINYNNTTTWQQSSDIRIKQNINTIENAIDIINKLNPVIFDYTDDFTKQNKWNNKKQKSNYGFIAQDFEKVFEKYVNTTDGIIDDKTVNDFKSIDTGHLIPVLVKAIQELQEKLQRNNIN